MRYLTAGESHGPAIAAILEGMPAGVPLSPADINRQLKRRQLGYGRGRRMQIEPDAVEILGGVRHGVTLGSPITFLIRNRDWNKWQAAMAVEPPGPEGSGDRPGPAPDPGSGAEPTGPEPAATAKNDWRHRPVTRPRPGPAAVSGAR
ncbi:MAG: chorismate synthase, partial [Firmicutes bacterium]|nr:chorismate synthase [Bacillota bacterium]